MKDKPSKKELKEKDNVTIKSDEKNRAKGKIGIVHQLLKGQDVVIRGVCHRAGKSYLEQPIKYLYPLELDCDANLVESNPKIHDTKILNKMRFF